MRTVDLAALKDKLVGVPGISGLTQTNVGGRMVFGFDGLVVGIDPSKTDDEIASTLIEAADAKQAGGAVVASDTIAASLATPMPQPAAAQAAPQPKAKTMTTPAPGSFSARLKSMLDTAKSGLDQAQAAGEARVKEAVGKLADAQVATAKVSESMAKQIEDAASSALADLGQISNEI